MGDEVVAYSEDAVYLGLNMTQNRTKFNTTVQQKAEKAMFSLLRLLGKYPPPELALKLFRQLIQPIALYGAEIWLPFYYGRRTANPAEVFTGKGQLAADKLWAKFIKMAYSLSQETSTTALRGEMGEHPLYIDGIKQVQGYLAYITGDKAPELITEALQALKCDDTTSQISQWWNSAWKMMSYTTITPRNNHKRQKRFLVKQLKKDYESHWLKYVQNPINPQFYWYSKYKKAFCLESYLKTARGLTLGNLIRFRTTDHQLPVETVRRRHLLSEYSVCYTCVEPDNYLVFDEYHLSVCPIFHDLRQKYNIPEKIDEDSFIDSMKTMTDNWCFYIHTVLDRIYRHQLFQDTYTVYNVLVE